MASTTESEVVRKYALTKIAKGDYLLPSNDGRTLWRIHQYTDGPSFGLDPETTPRDFEVWGVRKWDQPIRLRSVVDVEDWDRWEHVSDGHKTRAEAIGEAMRLADEARTSPSEEA